MSGYGGIFRSPSQPGQASNTQPSQNEAYGSDHVRRQYARSAKMYTGNNPGQPAVFSSMQLDFIPFDQNARINSLTVINYSLICAVRIFVGGSPTPKIVLPRSPVLVNFGGADCIVDSPNVNATQCDSSSIVLPVPSVQTIGVDFVPYDSAPTPTDDGGWAYLFWTTKEDASPSSSGSQ